MDGWEADGREVRSRVGGLVHTGRGLSQVACRAFVERWESGCWGRGLCFGGSGSRVGGLIFHLVGLEPTTAGREAGSWVWLVCRARGASRAVVDRGKFG